MPDRRYEFRRGLCRAVGYSFGRKLYDTPGIGQEIAWPDHIRAGDLRHAAGIVGDFSRSGRRIKINAAVGMQRRYLWKIIDIGRPRHDVGIGQRSISGHTDTFGACKPPFAKIAIAYKLNAALLSCADFYPSARCESRSIGIGRQFEGISSHRHSRHQSHEQHDTLQYVVGQYRQC